MIKNKPLFYTGLTMFVMQLLLIILAGLDVVFPNGVNENSANIFIGVVFIVLMNIAAIVLMIIGGTHD